MYIKYIIKCIMSNILYITHGGQFNQSDIIVKNPSE